MQKITAWLVVLNLALTFSTLTIAIKNKTSIEKNATDRKQQLETLTIEVNDNFRQRDKIRDHNFRKINDAMDVLLNEVQKLDDKVAKRPTTQPVDK